MHADFQSILIRLTLAVILAGFLGLERERKGRAAGLRTHVLVCLGATLAMIVADELARAGVDRGRIAQGVITGVGFLGAGTIIRVRRSARGLTTAAMVWFVAAMGIAIGLEYYALAIAATAFAGFAVLALEPIAHQLLSPPVHVIEMQVRGGLELIGDIEKTIQRGSLELYESEIGVSYGDGLTLLRFDVASLDRDQVQTLLRDLHEKFDSIESITVKR
jgi:putative Mg2+ transporter-C (MgtC) family protein